MHTIHDWPTIVINHWENPRNRCLVVQAETYWREAGGYEGVAVQHTFSRRDVLSMSSEQLYRFADQIKEQLRDVIRHVAAFI